MIYEVKYQDGRLYGNADYAQDEGMNVVFDFFPSVFWIVGSG